jgi:hypothetical protein
MFVFDGKIPHHTQKPPPPVNNVLGTCHSTSCKHAPRKRERINERTMNEEKLTAPMDA